MLHSFTERAAKSYVALYTDLLDMLRKECQGAPEMQVPDVHEHMRQVNKDLVKGCAKYARAVHSITSQPAMVHHALTYHDAHAVRATCPEFLQGIDRCSVLTTMGNEKSMCFWKYIDEISRMSYEATGTELPRTPSREEIAQNIQQRKGGSATPAPGGLRQGVVVVEWNQ